MTTMQKNNLFWVFLGLAVFLPHKRGVALDLVRDGKPAAVIVIPDKPLPVVTAAADELAHHIEKASGAKLAIFRESRSPKAGAAVYLGATKAAAAAGLQVPSDTPNAFVIKLVGKRLFMLGDDSDGQPFWILHNNRTRVGTLFAGLFFTFAERLGFIPAPRRNRRKPCRGRRCRKCLSRRDEPSAKMSLAPSKGIRQTRNSLETPKR